jgi:hypothetical protein
MYFIKQGIVEVFNSNHDYKDPEVTVALSDELKDARFKKNKPILYLPKFSYFGDY